jgi:hypothetical protein
VMMGVVLSHVRPNGMPTPASYPRPLGDRAFRRNELTILERSCDAFAQAL